MFVQWKLPYGVIGNTSGFGPEELRFESLWGNDSKFITITRKCCKLGKGWIPIKILMI